MLNGKGRVLVLAATEMEIIPLLDISTILSKTVSNSGREIIIVRLFKTVFTLIITGVGVVNTAHALTCAIEDHIPEIIIQAGIGGAFGASGIFVGDIAVAESDTYIHTGVEAGFSESSDGGGTLALHYPHAALPFDLIENQPATRQGRFLLNPALFRRAHAVILLHAVSDEKKNGAENRNGNKDKNGEDNRNGEENYNEKKDDNFKVICGNFITVSTITATPRRTHALYNAFSPCMESMEGAAAAHVASLYNIPFLEIRAASNLVGIRDKSLWNIPLAVSRTCLALTALFKK